MNAILNKNSESVRDCIIYVGLFPCNECAKIIVQSGIKKVIFFSDKHKDKNSTIASKQLLYMAKVTYTKFIPKIKKIVIDFNSLETILLVPLGVLNPSVCTLVGGHSLRKRLKTK